MGLQFLRFSIAFLPTLFILHGMVLSLCFSAQTAFTSATPIKIGAVFSESGLAAPHNKPLIRMTKFAVEEINKTGGVLGQPIELVFFDNLSSPIGSAIAARKCILFDTVAVIGAHWSSHSLAMAPLLQEAKIPMISPGSTNPSVTRGKDYIFRACFIDSFQGLAMAKFTIDELQVHSAVVATNIDEDYSTTLSKFFSTAFTESGGKILAEIDYRGDATDFSELITTIKDLNPDVIYLPGYTRDSGLFIKQAVNMGVTSIFLGGDAWDEIENYAGTAVNGSYQSAPWHPEVPFAESKKMRQLYVETYGTEIDNMSSPLAYDAVMLLTDAIKRAGSINTDAIRNALASTRNFNGATGKITINSDGNPSEKPIIIIKFENGKRIYRKAIVP